MVKTPGIEKFVIITLIILEILAIFIVILGFALIIEGDPTNTWYIILIGMCLSLLILPSIIFMFKKLKCNKADGTAIGYKCYINGVEMPKTPEPEPYIKRIV